MKTIFTLLLATVFTSSAFAYDEGKITITTAVKKDIQVYVDGRLYQENDNLIVLNDVQPGNHTIKIYKTKKKNNNNGYGNGRDRRKNQNQTVNELVYSSTVYVRPSYHVDVVVNRFGKALVDERSLTDGGKDWDDEWNESDNGGDHNNDYRQAISDYEFNRLVQNIRNQWFGKLASAKDALNANYFNTSQVKQLLQVFSSESDKLELAKLSYKNVVDRQNFRQLYDLFTYSSQSELDRYTKEARY